MKPYDKDSQKGRYGLKENFILRLGLHCMRAVIVNSPGEPEQLEIVEIPKPRPRSNEVLVRVAAAGLNRADLLQRRGHYPPPPGASSVFGMEFSGIVEAMGESASRWRVGDRVCAIIPGGGYAEYVTVPWDHCLPVPDNVVLKDAAALPEAITTVWANVFEAGALKPHETLLMHGGGSGIGTMAIQMVKAYGAKIFVTVGNSQKVETCQRLGADLVIPYNEEDFGDAVFFATEQRGVDVVLDMQGGSYFPRNLVLLAEGGRHVSLATQENKLATIDLRLVMQKRLIVTGSTLRARSAIEKARLASAVEANVWPWIFENKVKPLIFIRLPLNNVVEAHKVMERGEHIGKIILEVAPLE